MTAFNSILDDECECVLDPNDPVLGPIQQAMLVRIQDVAIGLEEEIRYINDCMQMHFLIEKKSKH